MTRASRHRDSQLLKTQFCVPADVTTVAHMAFQVVNRGGEEFLNVKDLNWTIEAANCYIHFNNLFGGDKILGKKVVLRVHIFTQPSMLHFPLFLSSAFHLTTFFVRFCAFFYFMH